MSGYSVPWLILLILTISCGKDQSSHPRAHPVTGNLVGVDLDRLDDALDACDFLISHLTDEGRYEVEERWGPEGDLYLYGTASVLVEAYRITGEEKYLVGARLVFDRMKRIQLPGGGWTLNLSSSGRELKITEQQRRDSWQNEMLPAIGAFTYAVAKYRRVTGDDRYNAMIERGMDRLMTQWDGKQGLFIEEPTEQREKLRSDPKTYQALFLLGLGAWQEWRTDLRPVVVRLTQAIRTNYESYDEQTMPFMLVLHGALLMDSREYVVQEIKPRLDELIRSPVFKCARIRGGYGHRDGVRGIVNTEANCRGTCAVAMGMKLYDLTTGTHTYRDSKEYREIAGWIDSMKDENGYFGYQTEHDMKRRGKGSPAQYIPCWWIFGTI